MTRSALMAVLLVLAGCAQKSEPPTPEAGGKVYSIHNSDKYNELVLSHLDDGTRCAVVYGTGISCDWNKE